MSEVNQKTLMPGVELTTVQTRKFKSAYLAVQMLVPLRRETAGMNALIPMVLRRGTEKHRDMEALSAVLDELYGGVIEPMARKKGETQCVGFVASFLDDAYVPGGSRLLDQAAGLLGELLLHPVQEGEGFLPDYVAGERDNLVDAIRAEKNDKRQYAMVRLVELMYENEPYGVGRLGSEEGAKSITGRALWAQYQKLLCTARIRLYYCGSAAPEQVEAAFRAGLAGLKRPDWHEECAAGAGEKEHRAPEKVREFEEQMDVTQGKLTMGFRTGGLDMWAEDYPALLLLNAVYGGTTTSKLFMNVREKLSLCYYASSQVEKLKGLMLVASGVEFGKRQEAQREILEQLENCRNGCFEDWEIGAARRSVVSSLATLLDSQSRMEDYWLTQAVAQQRERPEELSERIEQVTPEQITAAAKKIELDSIYFLRGKEGREDGDDSLSEAGGTSPL